MPDVQWIDDIGCQDVYSNRGFNGATYESSGYLPLKIDSSAHADLLYCLLGSGLGQVNGIRNFQGRVLDLVFCNEPCNVVVKKSDFPMTKVDSYHEPLEIEISVTCDAPMLYNPDEHKFNFKKANVITSNGHPPWYGKTLMNLKNRKAQHTRRIRPRVGRLIT